MAGTIPLDGTARIAVVGAGAIGCAVLPRLARMRVAAITIIDGDTVEAANLERQDLYAEVDVGHPKASTARGWVQHIGPAIDVIAVDRFLDATNADDLLRGHHVVVEAVDDLHAKRLVEERCAALGVPVVSGAVHRREAQVLVLHAPGADTALRRNDIFRGAVGPEQDGCDMRQVPLELIDAVGARLASITRAIIAGAPVANGALETLRHGRHEWTVYAPPIS